MAKPCPRRLLRQRLACLTTQPHTARNPAQRTPTAARISIKPIAPSFTMTRITDTKIDGRLAGTSRRQGNAASLVSVGRPRHSNKSRVSPPFIALLLVFVTSAVFGATVSFNRDSLEKGYRFAASDQERLLVSFLQQIEAGFDKPGAFYIDTEPPPANATKVIVGLYAMNCYEMLPLSNTYWFTGYLFFRWTDRNYDPTTDFELNNLVQTVDGTIKQITQGIKVGLRR